MQNIALPQKIEFKQGEEQNRGLVVVEPCYPGYGTTIGNSLRRVLLSSLPGAAVVGVKIKGITHEFSAIPHIKEDVLEIVLNLKQLRLKVFSDEVVKLELNIHGEKEVKASDITKNSEVEIVNKDLVLAHSTDMAANLTMEIYVSKGKGYETIESRAERSKEIGYIEIDSVFSPVYNVGVNIENTRVGKMINWDKLSLDILTDGTITPEEAFKQATKILISQFNALIAEPQAEEEIVAVAEEKAEVKEEKMGAPEVEKAEKATKKSSKKS